MCTHVKEKYIFSTCTLHVLPSIYINFVVYIHMYNTYDLVPVYTYIILYIIIVLHVYLYDD